MDLSEYLFEDIDYIGYKLEEPEKMCETCFPIKAKIKILGDRDPWYVVGYMDDEQKNGIEQLIAIKSWSKYKHRWTYKLETISSFLLEQIYIAPEHYGVRHKFNVFLKKLEKIS